MKKVLYIDGNRLSHHLSQMWHGEHECVTFEMMKKLAQCK